MGPPGTVIMFTLFIIMYVGIVKIFSILFRLTGLTDEKARFQAVSLLTNSGFTTKESELLAKSKLRRKLALMTMLFGYAFTVIVVFMIVHLFIALPSWTLVAMYGAPSKTKKRVDDWLQELGNRIMFGHTSNAIVYLEMFGEKSIARILVSHVPGSLQNTPCPQLAYMSAIKSSYCS